MQRGHIAHQNPDEGVAHRLTQAALTQAHGCIGNDAQIAAQIMCGLTPKVGALLLQLLNVLQCRFQILDVARCLLLLQLIKLRDTLLDSRTAERSPAAARLARSSGVHLTIILELPDHDLVELAELARDLAQIVSLLPTLQAVRCRLVVSRLLMLPCGTHARALELTLESRQQCRYVVV